VTFYQSTGAADRIREYNRNYLNGKNRLGITRIRDQEGNLVFSTQEDGEYTGRGYTCVRTPLELNDTIWYVESDIRTRDLTRGYWHTALLVLVAAVMILSMAGYYSRYFLRSIVRPAEEISSGLRLVEEGNLDVYIAPSGQYELRNMIHQFNAMVRRLRALIEEYEERVHGIEKNRKNILLRLLKERWNQRRSTRHPESSFPSSTRCWAFGSRKGDRAMLIKSCHPESKAVASEIPVMRPAVLHI